MAIHDKQLLGNNGEKGTKQEPAHAAVPTQHAHVHHYFSEKKKLSAKARSSFIDPFALAQTHSPQDDNEDKPGYLEELELEVDHEVEWMKQFTWLKIFLIIFGRWPITYAEDPQKRGYIFKFSWRCFGFVIYVLNGLFTLYCLIASSINVVDILMTDKIKTQSRRTDTEIIEQGLTERHTLVLIIILGSFGINTLTLFFIFVKRHKISETFTKWTQFLHFSKLKGSSANIYVGVALGNYIVVTILYLFFTISKTSATFIGTPTVVTILVTRNFLPANYLEGNFVGSSRHTTMHVVGLFFYFYIVTACNAYMYLFLWLLKSMEKAFCSWNIRMIWVVDPSALETQEPNDGESKTRSYPHLHHPRLTYHALYHDHIGLVRMLSWFNSIFACTLEPYVLFLVVRIVYQIYLGALVIRSNGKPLNQANVGKYFIRKVDYIPAVLLTYENCFMLLIMFLASSWLEDTAYDSYDVLRKNSLLKGTSSDKQSFFFLSMFQSYTSTTKMAVSGAHFFCINRYTILHALSAIMSNFLVVYQFSPLFDMDTSTTQKEKLRKTMGKFLESFEGLHPNHTLPVADAHRNNAEF